MDGTTDLSAVMVSLDTAYEAVRTPGSPDRHLKYGLMRAGGYSVQRPLWICGSSLDHWLLCTGDMVEGPRHCSIW